MPVVSSDDILVAKNGDVIIGRPSTKSPAEPEVISAPLINEEEEYKFSVHQLNYRYTSLGYLFTDAANCTDALKPNSASL